ncbi:DUF4396 domain-containing protein [Actinomadura sp. NAK00032]|uniref:DUF4396 domain-containing protein n=1 Tax=Actinomadura sp. NAK00032 TaxID=2742128 RepID=UPI00158FC55C|nr:DUF4396 domain-containing protein [Actinomadura sp. NAK00032]QKW33146.1 DUF4396 domain-containing protein [Actinomadura sp. NAK00032]
MTAQDREGPAHHSDQHPPGHTHHAADEQGRPSGGHAGGHGGHVGGHGDGHGGAAGAVSWGMAAQATLHCLTGCAIGEVLGMVIGTALGWSNAATIVLAVFLAFVFGYALTMRGVLKAGLTLRAAFGVALAADTVSIAVMEVLDNAAMVAIPGAMEAGLADPLFWGALAMAFLLAFIVTTPVNRWMIGRGKGHAVVHQYHH